MRTHCFCAVNRVFPQPHLLRLFVEGRVNLLQGQGHLLFVGEFLEEIGARIIVPVRLLLRHLKQLFCRFLQPEVLRRTVVAIQLFRHFGIRVEASSTNASGQVPHALSDRAVKVCLAHAHLPLDAMKSPLRKVGHEVKAVLNRAGERRIVPRHEIVEGRSVAHRRLRLEHVSHSRPFARHLGVGIHLRLQFWVLDQPNHFRGCRRQFQRRTVHSAHHRQDRVCVLEILGGWTLAYGILLARLLRNGILWGWFLWHYLNRPSMCVFGRFNCMPR
uniref:Uncharacterized protein n=1 Tax=uncultured marine virus TaxID=186617 RepID=A0A0F7L3B0_9VIRU|nr:hypothetical protein [uncultured marine virus]